MRVLVACERSGKVRDAFKALGHDAWSCDVYWTSGNHIHGDVLKHLDEDWDLMIAHPPCTHLSRAGARWWKGREQNQLEAIEFFKKLIAAPIKRIAVENPIGIINSKIKKPDQIIEPWMFGHGVTKSTCLWLKNLPKLRPTKIVEGRYAECFYEDKSRSRSMKRSVTYDGIAAAMAEQWGGKVVQTTESPI